MADSDPVFERLEPDDALARGTSVRPLGKLLGGQIPIWVITPEGTLAFLSAACGPWLGVAPQALVGLSTIEGNDDPLQQLARSLGSPSRTSDTIQFATVHPPSLEAEAGPGQPRPTTFLPLPHLAADQPGDAPASAGAVLAIAVQLADPDWEIEPPVARMIDAIRRHLAVDPRRELAPVTLGESILAQRLRHQIEAAGRVSSHVTLHGRAGSGAESVARLIDLMHRNRANDRPPGQTASTLSRNASLNEAMVSVDGPLMDAELFDATTGSILNAFLDREAGRAAVLIRDLDQMPHDAQQRLALLLGNFPQRLRVFATTSLDSRAFVPCLLPELAARLGMIEIHLPTMASRREDIPLLATSLLHRRHMQGETPADQLGRETLDRLVAYPWPGEFDELEAAIRNAARQCRAETVHVDHLPLAIRTHGVPPDAAGPGETVRGPLAPLDETLAKTERESILNALERCSGNRAAAARALEISRPRLLRRIEQLQIEWPPR